MSQSKYHDSCCSNEGSSCCEEHSHEASCCHEHHHHQEHEECLSEELLELADEAWMEVLKEKIKEHILNVEGNRLDQLAKIVSEANACRWKSKLAAKKGCASFKQQIQQFFSEDCGKDSCKL